MPRVEHFDIVFDNPECVYFAGQEITGKLRLELKEDKKINEVMP